MLLIHSNALRLGLTYSWKLAYPGTPSLVHPNTPSPFLNFVTPSPTSTTVPEASQPTTMGHAVTMAPVRKNSSLANNISLRVLVSWEVLTLDSDPRRGTSRGFGSCLERASRLCRPACIHRPPFRRRRLSSWLLGAVLKILEMRIRQVKDSSEVNARNDVLLNRSTACELFISQAKLPLNLKSAWS